jgi:hypothetical protein
MAMRGLGETQTPLGDGAEATPEVTFADDLNTGIWRSGADQVAFSTNGAYAGLFINSGSSIPRLMVKGFLDLSPNLSPSKTGVYGQESTGLILTVNNGSAFYDEEGILVSRRGYHVYTGATGSEGYYRRMHHTSQTTDATPTVVLDIGLTDDHVGLYNAMVVGRDAAGTERCAYSMQTMVHREGGGGAVLGTPAILLSDETSAGLDAAFGVSGNNLRITVTGLAGVTIRWALTFNCVNVS